jgi:hypothetical protein
MIGLPSRPRHSAVRLALTTFIIFHLAAITAWSLQSDSPLIQNFNKLIRPYMLWTGLFQNWDMFAPDPSKLNCNVGAVVEYRDGTRSLWSFPKMESMGLVDKYFRERWRKYANDNLRLDTNAALWPDAARYVARQNNRPGNPPVAVSLLRYWSEVPPPAPNGIYEPAPWQWYTFFRYPVEARDLP